MVVFPNAKINIGLQVTRKRKDGYHDIVSCFVPVPYHDVLEIIRSSKFSFATSGISIPGNAADNLCVRAYRLLKKDFGLQEVSMHLHKIVPIGAGLGGGSADAAFVLRCISELFELFLADSLLEDYAAQLGSDCPFFIRNRPMMAYGTGNEFEAVELPLAGRYVALVTPPLHVSTAEAYAGIQPVMPEQHLKEILTQTPIESWKHTVKNDFENTVFLQYPELSAIKNKLYEAGALYASMSGSGSTLYGLFNSQPQLQSLFSEQHQVQLYLL